MQKDLLVLTDREAGGKQGAALTYRLVLPPLVACDLHSLMDYTLRIWWAERYVGKVYLKACLDDCRIYIRHTRNGERQFVAVGKIDMSTYFYRDKPTCPLEGIMCTSASGRSWQVVKLDRNQVITFANHSNDISPIVLSLQDAGRINRRILRAYWPNVKADIIYPKKLWKTFKSHASISELVRVNGLDPYETSVVAALMDIGAAFSVREVLQCLHGSRGTTQPSNYNRNSTRIRAPAFIPLASTPCSIALRKSLGCTSKAQSKGISIEHERIVAALAYRLDSMHLMPYVSRLVDLAVINDRSALFFEVKTVDNGNLLDQVRGAIGQLLEYRFTYKDAFDCIHLIFIAPAMGSLTDLSFAKAFLSYCGIDWVVWLPSNSQFKSLEEILDRFHFGLISPRVSQQASRH